MTGTIITVYQCFHYKPLLLRALKLTHKNSLRTAAWSTKDKQIPLTIFGLKYMKSRMEIRHLEVSSHFGVCMCVHIYIHILKDGSEALFP